MKDSHHVPVRNFRLDANSKELEMTDTNTSNPFLESKKEWEETTLKQTLERRPERQEKFITTSSTPIERLYTPKGTEPAEYLENINLPGQYPYTRGVHATGYRGGFEHLGPMAEQSKIVGAR